MRTNRPSIEHFEGCLLGGAVGDALGAPLEFLSSFEIVEAYGAEGIYSYVEFADGIGRITDDTQMALFTAEGLLRSRHRAMTKGIRGAEPQITYSAYRRWLGTQQDVQLSEEESNSWLLKESVMQHVRAPGSTCLSALQQNDFTKIAIPANNSKGCGGVMRIAPVGLLYHDDAEHALHLGCTLAALTHGHASGYWSAGAFAAIIALLMQGARLRDAVAKSMQLLAKQEQSEETVNALEDAVNLVDNVSTPSEGVEQLGGGWVAEEALAIAVYCALVHENDFHRGVLLSIHHGGDSDSTGAMTGNLLGVINGTKNIPGGWITNLEGREVIGTMATDLFKATQAGIDDAMWHRYPPY